ncbi:SAM-dependent chlorinase/fluorinase [Epilithonimonas sp. JDS]|uniref:SAM hydrolase/SAM-dependent halogenase family protein n=1 Tax=Epilithonimonas sp. JDS TaxID=2902797 RepID=UPI001E525119|nr:SAM-dependent chlorinase/fluorinase [Epilithonimonas sp. JDS]MCD9855102.1 SAM-dependent chlorinase/fluorinase [Epilithonimonas sp. JDS]
MSVITLTSDYGLVDHRVASMKGKILSWSEEVKVVDITHNITAYNLLQTAYIVRNAYKFFPEGSIHIIAVDSFYHKSRKNIIAKVDGHYFISADNGITNLMFFDIKPEAIYEITLNNRFDDKVIFPATEIFVPAAMHLYKGGLPEVIGRKIKSIKDVSFPRAIYNEAEKMIVGEVMYIDNFGNVVSNISRKFFEKYALISGKFTVKFRNIVSSKVSDQYTDLVTDWDREQESHGKSSVIFNDADLLEITIYKGNVSNGASSLFGMSTGEKIYVEFE